METLSGTGLGARRNEDIALDLMKFVAGTAGVGKAAVGSTGFAGAAGTRKGKVGLETVLKKLIDAK